MNRPGRIRTFKHDGVTGVSACWRFFLVFGLSHASVCGVAYLALLHLLGVHAGMDSLLVAFALLLLHSFVWLYGMWEMAERERSRDAQGP